MAKMLEDAGAVRRFAFAACVDVVVDRVAERLLDSILSIRLVFAQPLDVVHQAVENAPLGIVFELPPISWTREMGGFLCLST